MKVYISADIEGISGLVAWSQCGRPRSEYFDYRWARERMTADVNAAIRGAKRAGATEVVVKDSHGNSKNLLVDQLEPGTRLISGHGAQTGGMMNGVDRSFSCAFLVGYHAMAGTESAVMEHTVTGNVHRMWINGMPAGEIALSSAVAGCFDVPVTLVTSDRAGCREATALLPGVQTAEVKVALGRYSADCLHPADSEALIEARAQAAVEAASSLDPWLPETPTTIRIEFNRTEEADQAARCPGARRLDAYTLEVTGDTWSAVHQSAWALMLFGGMGSDNNQ